MNRESSGDDRQIGIDGIAVVEFPVLGIEKREAGDRVVARKELEFGTPHAVFGAFGIGGRKRERLDDRLFAAGERYLDLAGLRQVIQLGFDGPGLCGVVLRGFVGGLLV